MVKKFWLWTWIMQSAMTYTKNAAFKNYGSIEAIRYHKHISYIMQCFSEYISQFVIICVIICVIIWLISLTISSLKCKNNDCCTQCFNILSLFTVDAWQIFIELMSMYHWVSFFIFKQTVNIHFEGKAFWLYQNK